jgi:hypothetical protein
MGQGSKTHSVLIPTVTGLLAATTLLWAQSAGVSHYPDITAQTVSDNHLIIRYAPEFSADFSVIGRAELYPVGAQSAWGRVVLIAVPPGGDLTYSVNFSRAGTASVVSPANYISADMPLVVRGNRFEARGHRFVPLVVFPQRLEEGRLAAYEDFVIDVRFTEFAPQSNMPASLSRLDSVLAVTVVNPVQFYRYGAAPRSAVQLKPGSEPFAGSSTWARITVTDNAVTRVTGAMLQQLGLGVTTLFSDSIRMWYGGGINPADSLGGPEPSLRQIGMRVEDGGDGILHAGDYLLFYAEGPNRYEWKNGHFEYVKNTYNNRNMYWLSYGGYAGIDPLRWGVVDGAPTGAPDEVVTASRLPIRAEQEKIIKVDADGRVRNYFDWYWSDQPSQVVSINLVNGVPGDSVDVSMGAITDYFATSIALNGVAMIKSVLGNNYYRFWDNSGASLPGLNTLAINLKPGLTGAYLDFLNIDYAMRLQYSGGQMAFNSIGHAGYIQYVMTGYGPAQYVLDITDDDQPVLVAGVQITGDTARFQRPATGVIPAQYLVFTPATARSPTEVESATPGSLYADLSQYDCLVISPRRFQEALMEYQAYRLATPGYRCRFVAVEDIYNDFGFGLESPLAIRSYLRFAYEQYADPAPVAVLLVGDGHYDFLDNLGLHTSSFIPPFIWGREFSAGDDNFVYFGRYGMLDSDSSFINVPDRGWDMMIARWPVRSTAEISAHIAAIKQYESPQSEGSWRGRITYVADDEFKGGSSSEIIHTAQAETLAVYHTPVEYVKQKIYATDYPFASNGEKPSVNDAIVKAMNDGTLILNYIGHGSPDVWADEHILKKSTDLGRMRNVDKPTVIIAGSCSIGFFDDPAREGMAELLFRQEGGALETVSATRLVYATDNAIFNYDLYDAIFGSRLNVCEASYAAKTQHQYSYNFSLVRNDRSYVLFGDPLGRLGVPEYRLRFVLDSGSVLTPLHQFHFSGTVTDQTGNPAIVDGALMVTVYDSRIVKHHPLNLDYMLAGPLIFRGPLTVAGGSFSGAFVVPLDVDYGGVTAMISGYGTFATASAIGGRDSLSIATSAGTTTDNIGPIITFAIDGMPEFTSGDRVPTNATVVVRLSDISGINLTGGLGHRVELVIDNDNNTTLDLTDRFTYDPGSYQSGEFSFVLPDLTPDRHNFKIRAWDNANNRGVMEFDATPAREGRIAIRDLLNYPNPMEEVTEFFFELSESAEWAEVRIFTLSGKLIRTLRADNLNVGRNRRFSWDGRDFDGDRIAEGVYLYKLTAKGRVSAGTGSADNMAEAYGKLVLLN